MFDPDEYERQRAIYWGTSAYDSDYRSCLWIALVPKKLFENPSIPLTVEEMLGGLEDVYWGKYEPGKIKENFGLILPHLETLSYRYWEDLSYRRDSAEMFMNAKLYEHLFDLCFLAGHWIREEVRCRLANLFEKWCAEVEAPEPEDQEVWETTVKSIDCSRLSYYYQADTGEVTTYSRFVWLLIRELRSSSPFLLRQLRTEPGPQVPESAHAEQERAHRRQHLDSVLNARKKGEGEE